ncbi:hypothetical protein FB45DRAFT_41482 [Roridomyces roridus]|uniref:Uncharacterized protein n=1 Tax=Roridomyces roridus TaxID=1738132 RepID=A0AAD7FJU8_9AGAR|nr:hypothetical protein FB45DRAFT_41482 [Roridomyces roridus]
MILDDKVLVFSPPPPYTKASTETNPAWRTFSALPPHLLLQIVYATFSDANNYDGEDPREQRKTLYWLTVGLRRVNRLFYTTSMSVLRSIYLPAYDSLIREPYTSDPFPHSHSQSMRASLRSLQRETTTLDLFISLKVREDVWADDTELHLERDESFTDLFNLMQPRARLEDLVRDYGVTEGLVYIDSHRKQRAPSRTPNSSHGSLILREVGPPAPTSVVLRSAASYSALTARLSAAAAAATKSSASSTPFWWMGKGKNSAVEPLPLPSTKVTISPLPFSALSVSFSSRRIGLVLTGPGNGRSIGSRRTVVEVSRTRNEALEVAAQRLVWGLRDWLVDDADGL